MYPMVLDIEELGVDRDRIIAALSAEGMPGLTAGYACIHLLPMYQEKVAYGSRGFPWTSDICQRNVDYGRGICPVAETLHDSTYMGYEVCLHDLTIPDTDLIVSAFRKVWDCMSDL
jgi:hypothetical protein